MKLPRKGEYVSLKKVKELCIYFELYDLWDKIAENPPPKPFKSDGCSGNWPEVWKNKRGRKVSIYKACLKHDIVYWASYPNDQTARLIADAELIIDVVKITGNVWLAQSMFAGVRAGGGAMWKRSFSFGFGRV